MYVSNIVISKIVSADNNINDTFDYIYSEF